jgi:hypothetical protein
MDRISQSRLRELLDYDPDTGLFRWRVNRARAKKGSICGTRHGGRIVMRIEQQNYVAHELAWLWVYGEWPKRDVRHLDGNRENNALTNLRLREVLADGRPEMTQKRLRQLLDYDPQTGAFHWLAPRGGRSSGEMTGAISNGYLCIRIDGVRYQAHRLAWLYVHGKWPANHLDHINRNRADNRLENLREATPSQNSMNAREGSNSSTGIRGVSVDRRSGKYLARIRANGKNVNLGYYADVTDARDAREKAEIKFFGEFRRVA